MPNPYFRFKQFTVFHDRCAMKVTTDACLFGAWVARKLQEQNKPYSSILDIGTGTGLLSLMLAQKVNAQITALEIEQEAAQQAAENITASPWNGNITVIKEDVRAFLQSKKWDVIISNPPFYESDLTSAHKAKNTAHHSSELTLKQLAAIIKKNLAENGAFFLLLPYRRQSEAETLLNAEGLFLQNVVIAKQSYKHQPFRVLVMGSHQLTAINTSEISVWNDEQQYTEAFIDLLKDYYLYL